MLGREGVRVPADVSVAAFMASTEERLAGDMLLTCNRGFFVEMGRQAVRLLTRDRAHPEPPRLVLHRIGSQFEPGQTVGPVRKGGLPLRSARKSGAEHTASS